MAGSDQAARERRRIQRQISKELKAGTYRPRARSLTRKAREISKWGPVAEENIRLLGLDGLEDESKYRQICERYRAQYGTDALIARLIEQREDIISDQEGRYASGRERWEARTSDDYDYLYFYHGAAWAFM